MKAGDRALIEIKGESHFCNVIASESKSVLLLINEYGECIAKVQEFWRKTEPMLGQEPKIIETVKQEKRTSGTLKKCEAPGCVNVYQAKKADLARGWGRTCCKSCAAKLREVNKNASR